MKVITGKIGAALLVAVFALALAGCRDNSGRVITLDGYDLFSENQWYVSLAEEEESEPLRVKFKLDYDDEMYTYFFTAKIVNELDTNDRSCVYAQPVNFTLERDRGQVYSNGYSSQLTTNCDDTKFEFISQELPKNDCFVDGQGNTKCDNQRQVFFPKTEGIPSLAIGMDSTWDGFVDGRAVKLMLNPVAVDPSGDVDIKFEYINYPTSWCYKIPSDGTSDVTRISSPDDGKYRVDFVTGSGWINDSLPSGCSTTSDTIHEEILSYAFSSDWTDFELMYDPEKQNTALMAFNTSMYGQVIFREQSPP